MRNVEHNLKFADPLAELIVRGQKYTTWRMNNSRDLRAGDRLNCIHYSTLRLFAVAAISRVAERTFATLGPEDLEGHESFASEQTMLDAYARYYDTLVTSNTQLTVVDFVPWLVTTLPGSDETDVIIMHGQAA
jgi:hypothetical protein